MKLRTGRPVVWFESFPGRGLEYYLGDGGPSLEEAEDAMLPHFIPFHRRIQAMGTTDAYVFFGSGSIPGDWLPPRRAKPVVG